MSIPHTESLINALLDGDQSRSIEEAENLMAAGISREEIVIHAIEAAMEKLSEKCTIEQFNLLEIMLAGRAVTGVMKMLYPQGSFPDTRKDTIVIASLEGDVHDLGKNIFKMVLNAKGYRVIDCGKDCPVKKLVETAAQENAQVIGISGLITTIIPQVRQVREQAIKQGLGNVTIIAGGAALRQASEESLNVDFAAESVFDGVKYLDRMGEGKKNE